MRPDPGGQLLERRLSLRSQLGVLFGQRLRSMRQRSMPLWRRRPLSPRSALQQWPVPVHTDLVPQWLLRQQFVCSDELRQRRRLRNGEQTVRGLQLGTVMYRRSMQRLPGELPGRLLLGRNLLSPRPLQLRHRRRRVRGLRSDRLRRVQPAGVMCLRKRSCVRSRSALPERQLCLRCRFLSEWMLQEQSL